MLNFRTVFPEIAQRETRLVFVEAAEGAADRLPPDGYAFDELYCDERDCDCRRVMINVYSVRTMNHLATINHAFERPPENAAVSEQTFLDPLNIQTPLAAELMDLFLYTLRVDDAYRRRLIAHYRIFKNAINDPIHPVHRLLGGLDLRSSARKAPARRIVPPPPRRKKKWRS
jgi:hypothetical protein